MSSADKFKHHKKHSRHSSVDGFLSPGSFNRKSGSLGFPDSKKTEEAADKLDDFNRPDGYHSTVPAVTGSDSQKPLLSKEPRRRHSFAPPDTANVKKPKKQRWWRRIIHRPKSWPRLIAKSALVLGVFALLIGGYLAYKIYATQKAVLKGGGQAAAVCDGNVPVSKLHKEGDSRVNVLLVGIGGPGHDGPDLTDTMIIASVDTINDKVDLLSIPRDLWVQVPNYGTFKLNATYPNAKSISSAKTNEGKIRDGLSQLDKTISGITGVPIHYNVLVDFKAFKDAVNAVGGVTFYVPEQLYDPTIAWDCFVG